MDEWEQSCRPNARVSEVFVLRLSRQHVRIISWTSFASHEKTQFSHTFSSLSRLGSAFTVTLLFAVAFFLIQFLLSSLTFLLETLHNVNSSALEAIVVASIHVISIRGS